MRAVHHQTMRIRFLLLATLILSGSTLPLPAQNLQAALGRMDKAAQGFRGITAKMKQVSHTAIINDTATESGTITLYRPKPKDLRMLVQITEPEARGVAYASRKVQIFYPKINTVQEYDLGKQASLIDQFLLLGFGTPGSELLKSYDVNYGASETLNGVKTDRIELTPKSQEALKHVRRIEIWVSESSGQPVQQKIYQPSRDYRLITYTDLKVNPPLGDDSVKLKLPKGVKKETPQK